MQLISALAISILALVTSISASPAKPVALTPNVVAAAGFTNIHDFQGNSLNLVGNINAEGTAVIGFPSGFDRSNFIIANGLNTSLFLSYPAAPFAGSPDLAGTVVFSEFPAVFSLEVIAPPSSAVSIVEVTHQLALTSWPSVPGVDAVPVTLSAIDPGLQAEQTWTIVAAGPFSPSLSSHGYQPPPARDDAPLLRGSDMRFAALKQSVRFGTILVSLVSMDHDDGSLAVVRARAWWRFLTFHSVGPCSLPSLASASTSPHPLPPLAKTAPRFPLLPTRGGRPGPVTIDTLGRWMLLLLQSRDRVRASFACAVRVALWQV
ncbi:hypothetical protein B0H16DRAFT_1899568 [Mycena metata]|uniref:Uncharacterized protein n=1 Tax=Mycena metata TaxID=1033252 RepID=A0AAD7H6S4_9AGAR|nr:hypothetical protein B0H16DRAFT_1899568 [Mycena metata]